MRESREPGYRVCVILTIDEALREAVDWRNFHVPLLSSPCPLLLPSLSLSLSPTHPLSPQQSFLPYFRVPGSSGEPDGITLESLSSLPLIHHPPRLHHMYSRPSQSTSLIFSLFSLFLHPLINVDFDGCFLLELYKIGWGGDYMKTFGNFPYNYLWILF